MLTKIAHSQDQSLDRDADRHQRLYLALKLKIERSQRLSGCQDAIFLHPLTAFFPWSWQLLQVLHSMHCHHRALTRAVSSGENLRQDGWPAGRQTHIHKQARQHHTHFSLTLSLYFFYVSCWLTVVTYLHHWRKKKKRKKVLLELEALTESNLAAKSALKHKWQSVRAVLLQCLKSGKQDGLVWDETPLREEEEHACLLPIRDVGP